MEKKITTGGKVEVKAINSSTEDNSGSISLTIEAYNVDLNDDEELNPMNISNVEILEERKKIDSTLGLEGELLISKNKDMIINLDISGELIISDKYASNYSINDQGELIYQR